MKTNKKNTQFLNPNFKIGLSILVIILLFSKLVFAQSNGDFRSVQSGNWSSTSVWQIWDGGKWKTPTNSQRYPGYASTPLRITIQSTHQVTLDIALSRTVSSTSLLVDGILNVNKNLVIANKGQVTVNGIITFVSDAILSGGSGTGSNASLFTLSSGGKLVTQNPDGISTTGTTGSIRVTGTKTYSATGKYEFNGTAPQVTGNALPNLSSGGILTISNVSDFVTIPNFYTIGVGAKVDIIENAKLNVSSLIINFGTLAVAGTLQLSSGGSIFWNAPVYQETSTLIYNQSGKVSVSYEWSSNGLTPGAGIPKNVIIQNNTTVSMPSSARSAVGNVDIKSGSIELNASESFAFYIGGDFNTAALGNIKSNNKELVFNGNGAQRISNNSSNTATFPSLVIDKSNGNVILENDPPTDLILNGNSGNVLHFKKSGKLDLNGNNLIFSGNGGNIQVDTDSIFISGNGKMYFEGSKTFSGGKMELDESITIDLGSAVNFGQNNLVKINGVLNFKDGASVVSNSPNYGANSVLEYTNSGTHTVGLEWNGNKTVPGVAVPNSVRIKNNVAIQMSNSDHGIPGDLLIDSGSITLHPQAGNLFVGGNWTRKETGKFFHNNRSVTFNGNGKTKISAPISIDRNAVGAMGGEIFHKLYISKSTKSDIVELATNVAVENEIGFVKGVFDLSYGDVTLVSNENITARVAPINNLNDVTINYSDTGKFIIHRHLPINTNSYSRRWRLLAAPIKATSTGDISINSAWQAGTKNTTLTPVDPKPGYGTTLTNGNSATAVTNGFDLGTTLSPSIYYLKSGELPSWVAPTTTYAPITNQEGYMIFVRGHRGIGISNQYTIPDSTTLEPKGQIITGDVTKTLIKGMQIIGNPYASSISFNNIIYNGVKPGSAAGVGLTYYLWDPKSPGASNVGQWITFSSNGDGTYSVSPKPVSNFANTGVIESGSAFLINASAAGTMVIHESDKIAVNSTKGIASRPVDQSNTKIEINMYYKNADNSQSLLDGTAVIYNTAFRDSIDLQDAGKVATFTSTERISIVSNEKMLSIERRKTMDTVFVSMNKVSAKLHVLEITATSLDPAKECFLEDRYLKTFTSLQNNNTILYEFNVTSLPASSDSARFRIVFRGATTLPVNISKMKISLNENKVNVLWKSENEENVKFYELERSSNGVQFSFLLKTDAIKNNGQSAEYNVTDYQPISGDNYYRIKIITKSGEVYFSEISKVKYGSSASSFSIFPNPVVNKTLNLLFERQPMGVYKINISSMQGQTIYTASVNVNAYAQTETIVFPSFITRGTYLVEITQPNLDRVVNKIEVL